MATLKNMIIETLVHGKNTLQEIDSLRKYGTDFSLEAGRADKTTGKYHAMNLQLVVSDISDNSSVAKTIQFVAKKGLLPVFQSGQYINIFTTIDGVRTSRPYSISSSSKQRAYFEITVARIATGFVSDYLMDKIKVGDEFEANGPAGTFFFNPIFHSKKSVFLAGGSGITPFMSMAREVLGAGLDRQMHLIYGCRNEEVVLFKNELEELDKKHSNFTFSLVLSDSPETYHGLKGFIDAKMIKNLVKDTQEYTYYICGPQVMNDFCVRALDELGVPKRMIRREMFGAQQDITKEPGWPTALNGKEEFEITVDGDKKIKAISGESLLCALERAGVRVNVCCRSGECSLCRVQLLSGNVFMARGVLSRQADEKFGYIHSCKAFPISNMEIRL